MNKRKLPIEEFFWTKVDKGEGDSCWVWTAGCTDGYGTIEIKGVVNRTHRLSWELSNGPIPPGMYVLHKCDNRPCVRPDHLYLGTHQDNMDDMNGRKRQVAPRGEDSGTAKLTEEQVLEMRELYASTKLTTYELARRYGIGQYTTWRVVTGNGWKHVGGPIIKRNEMVDYIKSNKKDEIKRRMASGEKIKDIAKNLGMSLAYAYDIVNDYKNRSKQ